MEKTRWVIGKVKRKGKRKKMKRRTEKECYVKEKRN